jgi:hypothetical protein
VVATVAPTGTDPSTTYELIATPAVDLPKNRFMVPGLGMIALGSALGVLEISKRPRRAQAEVLRAGPSAGADL